MGIDYQKGEDGIVVLTVSIGDKSINTLGSEFVRALADVVPRLEADQGLRGVILTSAKQDFISGADIDELYAIESPEQALAMCKTFKTLARRLETLGKPVVAAINGTALGGGYEVALCCHHRIALDRPETRIGFPEVTLGLFPGGGGTQRLPRMIGVQAALPILLEGKRYTIAKALELGLLDALAADEADMMARARSWIEAHPDAGQPWDRRGFRWPGGAPNGPELAPVWMMAGSMLTQKTRDLYPAQRHALASIHEGSLVAFDTGDAIETRYFAKTAAGQTAKNMINAFWYQLGRLAEGASRPEGIAPGKVARLGVLGAGMMGAGIAWAAASRGVEVVLKDVSEDRATAGKDYSRKLLEKQIARGRKTAEQAAAILARIVPTDNPAEMAGCDLVIEAVFEDRALKATVTAETEAVLAPDKILASNTSTLPITGLAEASSRPDKFIGLHFFSPVEKMKLVEIIVGEQTSDETLAHAFDFVLQIGKVPIVVNDARGFYTSRVFSTYVNEGMALLAEGRHPRAIESAGLAAGMPVGPLAVSDEVSLSLMHHIRSQTRRDLGDAYTASPGDPVIEKMVTELDRPGKKAGRGFYDYPSEGPKRLWPGLAEAFPPAPPIDQQTMIDRLVFVQALESVRCLEEGVVRSVADANIGSIMGWGFAAFHGGTLQMINTYGLEAFATRAEELAAQAGPRFSTPELLRRMIADGEEFQ